MKIQVLVDNSAAGELVGEWGLSVYITFEGRRILLDAGTTHAFYENALAMGVDLATIDAAVLSHAHYDHANGMDAFFENNSTAGLYVRKGTDETCYGLHGPFMRYNGIRKGLLDRYASRIIPVEGDYELFPGVWLIPHKSPELGKKGKAAGMYRRQGFRFRADDFSHEQSLVFCTEKGLVVCSSCSHAGADTIIREIQQTFPEEKIYMLLGGFHLFRSSRAEVVQMAENLQQTGVEKIVTGHCTGDAAFAVLQEVLGDRAEKMFSGYTIEI